MDDRYLERRHQIEMYFTPESVVPGSNSIHTSPSGEFQIETSKYFTSPGHWNYSRGIVTRLSDGEVIADVKRNIGHFWHTWIHHPNGADYLICGEDYQGYSVINLNLGTCQVYFPEEGYSGVGFCWTEANLSADGQVLTVEGCFWAAPYERVTFDFRDPEKLPYPELSRIELDE